MFDERAARRSVTRMSDRLSTMMEGGYQAGTWSAAEVAHVFTRLLVDGWFERDMNPDLAERWGTRAGHYGRIALAEMETPSVMDALDNLCNFDSRR